MIKVSGSTRHLVRFQMDKSSSTKVAHQETNIIENIYEKYFITTMSCDSEQSDDGGAAERRYHVCLPWLSALDWEPSYTVMMVVVWPTYPNNQGSDHSMLLLTSLQSFNFTVSFNYPMQNRFWHGSYVVYSYHCSDYRLFLAIDGALVKTQD